MVKGISWVVVPAIALSLNGFARGQSAASRAESAPRADSTLTPATSKRVDDRDVVLFAGETVEFRLPHGWQAQEAPFGREIRLMLGPAHLPRNPRNFDHGLWLTYHRLPTDGSAEPALPEELVRRLRFAEGRDVQPTGQSVACALAGHAGLKQPFQLASAENQQLDARGFHVLARTPWGVLEWHGVAPADEFVALEAKWREILATLRVYPPPSTPTPKPEIRDAAPLVGSWKSLRARFIFLADGGVEIRYDRTASFALDEQGNVRFDRLVSRITGHGQTRGRLLFVTWDDGSRQNYRWKIYRGDLLLTDHSGHVSHLKRLFDLR